MRTLVVIALLVLDAAVAAAPKTIMQAPQGPPSAPQQAMAAQLRLGRELAQKGQNAAAIAAFDAALRAVPNEPRVLSELGWVLREAGDLVRAEAACKKAVQVTQDPLLRAPTLYNLGRVLEQKGDKKSAIIAYRDSLKLRENRVVRERLLDLDPSMPRDTLHPEPMEGPYPAVERGAKNRRTSAARATKLQSLRSSLRRFRPGKRRASSPLAACRLTACWRCEPRAAGSSTSPPIARGHLSSRRDRDAGSARCAARARPRTALYLAGHKRHEGLRRVPWPLYLLQ